MRSKELIHTESKSEMEHVFYQNKNFTKYVRST